MMLTLKLFASVKTQLGQDFIELHLTDGDSVGALKRGLIKKYPEVEDIVSRSMIAVDHEYANDDFQLVESELAGKEIAIIPPVSGG